MLIYLLAIIIVRQKAHKALVVALFNVNIIKPGDPGDVDLLQYPTTERCYWRVQIPTIYP